MWESFLICLYAVHLPHYPIEYNIQDENWQQQFPRRVVQLVTKWIEYQGRKVAIVVCRHCHHFLFCKIQARPRPWGSCSGGLASRGGPELGCANKDLWVLCAPIFIIVVYCKTATRYFWGVRNNWYHSYNSTTIEIGAQKFKVALLPGLV